MTEPTLDTLTQRLDRLERENRRLKVAGAILLLALAAVGAMGQMTPRAVPKVVEAERFVLRDTKGNILAIMGTEASGTSLSLYDQKGKPRAWLGVTADGAPVLALFDQNGKDRAGLVLGADGTPALALLDQNGKRRAVLSTLVDGTPGLLFADQNERAGQGWASCRTARPRYSLLTRTGRSESG